LRILGAKNFSTANQIQQLNELNLKEGQKVMGKISNIDHDEVLLEVAGHTIQAKIEGDPPMVGTNQTFGVTLDAQGRTLLKVIKNILEGCSDNQSTTIEMGSPKVNVASEDVLMQKAITATLIRNGLPASTENVAKVTRYIQDFQSKYQQPINAQVFSFIIAQKWPCTPATILASWIYQEPEIRDLLREKLQKTLPEKEDNAFLSLPTLKTQSDVPEIINKLKLFSGLSVVETKSDLTAGSNKNHLDAEIKTNHENYQGKIQSILDQNIAIHKAILKESTVDGFCNFIPLLVSDSQSNIHECFVEWKTDKNNNSHNATKDQSVNITIPTENLDVVNLALRISSIGVHIDLRVDNEEVRQYLKLHTPEMKTAISRDNAVISINLKEKADINPPIHGVDLWM
jgi:hypothetical protein